MKNSIYRLFALCLLLALSLGDPLRSAPPEPSREILRVTAFDGYTFVLEARTTLPLVVSITRADGSSSSVSVPSGVSSCKFYNWDDASVFATFKIYDPATGRIYKRGDLLRYR